VAYALVDRLTARTASGVRYAVALSALGLMPLMVTVTFAVEMQSAAPAQMQKTGERIYGAEPHDAGAWQVPPMTAFGARDRGTSLATRAEELLPWVDGVWLFGVLVLALRALGGWVQLEQVRRRARGIVPAHLEQSFQRVRERIHVGREVALRISDEVISPLAMGVWRSTVILPVSAVLRLSSEELEAVLAHELGHIRRWDYVCNLFQVAVESVLFFHPAVWWVSKAVRDRREICCDEIAVGNCVDAVVYARALLTLEEQKTMEFELAMALKGRKGLLLGRVEKVLGEDRPMVSGMTSGVRVMVAGAVVAGLLLGPRVGDAVAASRPMVSHVAALLPAAISETVHRKASDADAGQTRKPHAGDVDSAVSTQLQSDSATSETASLRVGEEASATSMMAQAEGKSSSKGISYLDGMRDAGYPLDLNDDLNALVSLKSLGVTPEYAKQMGKVGLGKPTVHELISLKSLGITPEYVAGLKQSGIGPKDFHEVVTEKALGITPEYATAMKKSGFGDLDVHELISMKAQNVTPEYATWLKQQFPQATMNDLRKAAVFHLDDKFVAAAKSHGMNGTDLDKLLRLKISGLLDE
jgi:beta-lactamase regulating signal transducer with metallopeptidase domain